MAKSEKKFKELILLICARSEHDPKFGAIKLNKLLFHSDFSAYLVFGKPISGQEYFKLPNGPAPRRFLPVAKRMQESGDLAYKEADFFGHSQKKPIALRQPDVSVFTPQEIDLVHKIIQKFWNMTATAISEHSHLFMGWKIARDKETIPYATALVSYRQPTPTEQAYGLQLEPLAQQLLNCSADA
jgi:hypothetical protein